MNDPIQVSDPPPSPAFHRDWPVMLGYAGFGLYSFCVALLGPAVPFLRAELHLTYAAAGLHATMLAIGAVVVGAAGERLTRRLSRNATFRVGAAGTGLAVALLALGRAPTMTLAAALLLGLGASILLTTAQALLSERAGQHQRIALLEAGVVASLSGSLAGLLIGAAQQSGPGWRAALILPVLGALALTFWRSRPPATAQALSAPPGGRLPRAFWRAWSVVLAVVTVEWCLSFWAATYLTSRGQTPSGAASLFSLYLLALLAGRLIGGVAIRRLRHSTRDLVVAALLLTGAGFSVFWLSHDPGLQLGGLLLTGLGVANLYPLTLSLALATALEAADLASARVSLAVGLAILVAPLSLGALADRIDLQVAYGLVPCMLLTALMLLIRRSG
ncbi:MFS transporter [Deinococcus sp. KSM4-11]|uniref:MFS transporter n=1 Tax=Deinococcus sp. KSM4-11 TaxID=2568654 RepID=UPI0010A53E0F|nr:MFS transporter [Deinococcus sp. KSM4-11]THF85321.1 MFS transporter [Deinococcus sp. KSM4-11]